MHTLTIDKRTSFLQAAAELVVKDNQFNPLDTCIILPSRRAATIFEAHYAPTLGADSMVMPATYTISDFFRNFAGLRIPDKDELLLMLFEIYAEKRDPDLLFENFSFWGQMMLSDFEEIDRYLVDASRLYSIILDEKLIEAQFSIESDLKDILLQFWQQVNEGKEFEQDFIETWQILADVYHTFKARLLENRSAYEGMAYRFLLEQLIAKKIRLPYRTFHFVGFNAFSVVEEQLIHVIAQQYQVNMHWDTDLYFMEKVPKHEAGNFLRQYKNKFAFATHHWQESDELSRGKKIHLHGAPLHQGQVRVAAQLLQKETEGRTAVVLTDESLLAPLLKVLPKDARVNITMGKKVSDSPLLSLLELLFRLNAHDKVSKKDLEELSQHFAYINVAGEAQADALARWLKYQSGYYFTRRQLLQAGMIPKKLMPGTEDCQALAELWMAALAEVKSAFKSDEWQDLHIICDAIADLILIKAELLQQHGHLLSFEAAHRMLWQHIKSMEIPYRTDNTLPVQVMGFLETRLLDFERVIILGANEDLLPASRKSNSYIPYNLRRVFGLPTHQEFDGIYAYHFFRLLKRSRETHLIYNDTAGDSSFEKSRFIEQLMLELNTPENDITTHHHGYFYKKEDQPGTGTLTFPKTKEHLERMQQQRFSQSALSQYLLCPVQFYLQYLAGIKAPDTTEETIDAGIFGSILHETIEYLYADLVGKTLKTQDFEAKKPLIEKHLKTAFESQKIKYEELKGENLLAHDVIKASIEKLIDKDMLLLAEAPFVIEGLELKKEIPLMVSSGEKKIEVTIYGKIDRVDRLTSADGKQKVRILDYKTGKIELDPRKELNESELDKLFQRNNVKLQKQVFQGLFYHLLMQDADAVMGFYSLRQLADGVAYLNKGEPVNSALAQKFSVHVTELISEILNPEIAFVQNPSPDAYKNSPYVFVAPK